MSGHAKWRHWAVGLVVLVCALLVEDALATPRSVLIVHSGTYPDLERIRAELTMLEFPVMTLNNHEPSAGLDELVEWAAANAASVVIELVVVDDVLRISLYDAAVGRSKQQQFQYGAGSDALDRVDALQVVEYLRAALTPSPTHNPSVKAGTAQGIVPASTQASTVPKPTAPQLLALPGALPATRTGNIVSRVEIRSRAVELRSREREPALPSLSSRVPRPSSLWVSLAGGAAVMDKFKQWTPTVEAGVAWQVVPEVALSVLGFLPLSTASLASNLGTSKVQTWSVGSSVEYHFAKQSSQLFPVIGAGMAVYRLSRQPHLDSPDLGAQSWQSTWVLFALPTLSVGARWQPRERGAVTASLLVAPSLWVSDRIKTDWPEVRTLGRPAIFFVTIGVEWRTVAWGSRD